MSNAKQNPMLVHCPHPGCGAAPAALCRGLGVKVHAARRGLAQTICGNGIDIKAANSGFSLGTKIAKIMLRIATRGRAGPHDDQDEACGCGQCCSMLARGLVAHMEGVVASSTSDGGEAFDKATRSP